MSHDGMLHPTADRLEAYVEGTLDDAERAVLESHLVSCSRCQLEVEDWGVIFVTLASLPRIEPSPGFADRVMAGVRVHRPWTVRVAELLRRLVPTSTTGWALATALLALPALFIGGILTWVLSRPTITPEGLWLFVRARVSDGILLLAGRASSAVLESNTAIWLWETSRALLANVGAAELGAFAALFAATTGLSLWILYEYLFRTSAREKHYVMHCI